VGPIIHYYVVFYLFCSGVLVVLGFELGASSLLSVTGPLHQPHCVVLTAVSKVANINKDPQWRVCSRSPASALMLFYRRPCRGASRGVTDAKRRKVATRPRRPAGVGPKVCKKRASEAARWLCKHWSGHSSCFPQSPGVFRDLENFSSPGAQLVVRVMGHTAEETHWKSCSFVHTRK
jgi:hypothetical protein